MIEPTTSSRLRRNGVPPPVRIVHLGLGAFSRSHLAWYTSNALDAQEWGISAYTGRSRALADALTAQDGLYTLVERSADGDSACVVGSVVKARTGEDVVSLISDVAAEGTRLITLTITEAGYRVDAHGCLDRADPQVQHDLRVLAGLGPSSDYSSVTLSTALGRLVLALEARRRAGGWALTIMSCDNLPENGTLLRAALLGMADAIPDTSAWCREKVSFASTSVDRITPSLSQEEHETLSATYYDDAPVVAEPFSDWIIQGHFPAGRPAWESAGARLTENLEPWESRKLWLLNGAHTLLACLGQLNGHRTVAEAVNDPVCLRAVNDFWDEAEQHLPPTLDVSAYRAALKHRFANGRIEHQLSQIASDTPTKLRLRVVPVAVKERASGRPGTACALAMAAWLVAGHAQLVPLRIDLDHERYGLDEHYIRHAVASLSVALADDDEFMATVRQALDGLSHLPQH